MSNHSVVNLGASEAVRAEYRNRTLLGQPVGLFVLFFTEMWERFSYYGMRALLVLYMTDSLLGRAQAQGHVLGYGSLLKALEWVFGPLSAQAAASQIYGLYTGLVFLTPVLGGLIADRYWGAKKTVVVGGVIMAVGHFLMASEELFLVALLLLILGNGCFKPNVSTQVGGLYPPGDHRRDGAYTLFYMGINLGSTLSPLVCGTLGQKYGWHYGFSAAGVGMLFGLGVYMLGQNYLAQDRLRPRVSKTEEKTPLTRKEWKTILALGVLCFFNIIFWGIYEQQGNSLQIFADRNVDWKILGWEMPSTWFQSFNPIMILVFAPLLDAFWNWQFKRDAEPNSASKMGIGCILAGLSFPILVLAVAGLQESQRISVLWLVASTFVLTLGELYLSPIGLSLVTKVAPARLVGLMMGVWFLSSFFGNYMSGFLGIFYETMSKQSFFMMSAALGLGAGLVTVALGGVLKRGLGEEI